MAIVYADECNYALINGDHIFVDQNDDGIITADEGTYVPNLSPNTTSQKETIIVKEHSTPKLSGASDWLTDKEEVIVGLAIFFGLPIATGAFTALVAILLIILKIVLTIFGLC